jgi:ectoine hydroxylase-related dioxygenase (phytanoyl-CoA dioxygenase family)
MDYSYPFISSKDVDSVTRQLKRYGIAVVPKYLAAETLKTLNKEFERSLVDKADCIFTQEGHPMNPDGRTARMNPWHDQAPKEFPTITSVYRDSFMRDISQAYYSPHRFALNDEIFITHEQPCNQPLLPWHFDRIQSLKFWFYLTDTTKQNGAFEYCPGSHWEGRYRASYYLALGYDVEDLPNDIDEELIRDPVSLELNAGDLLIFDPDGFHRGGIVHEGTERRVMRGHTHPEGGRRYGDKPFSPGWWIRSPLNINRWFGSASARILGERIQDHTVNRKLHKM